MDQMRNIKISKSEVQEADRFGYRSLQTTAPEKVFRESGDKNAGHGRMSWLGFLLL